MRKQTGEVELPANPEPSAESAPKIPQPNLVLLATPDVEPTTSARPNTDPPLADRSPNPTSLPAAKASASPNNGWIRPTPEGWKKTKPVQAANDQVPGASGGRALVPQVPSRGGKRKSVLGAAMSSVSTPARAEPAGTGAVRGDAYVDVKADQPTPGADGDDQDRSAAGYLHVSAHSGPLPKGSIKNEAADGYEWVKVKRGSSTSSKPASASSSSYLFVASGTLCF